MNGEAQLQGGAKMVKSHRVARRTPDRPTTAQAARRRLGRSCHWQVRQVTCRYHEGVLLLYGQLPSYYLKQLAQEAVRNLEGVEEIINRIEVKR